MGGIWEIVSSAGWTRAGWKPPGGRLPPGRGRPGRSAARHIGDIQLRYATLIGQALDGPGILADADALYFILEGTREPPSPKPRPSR